MKNKIKQITRIGLPETNSSSSHSVSICNDGTKSKPGDQTWDLDIRDGILYIPWRDEFGWDYEKSNSCQTKIQYLCAHYCYDQKSVAGQKRIHYFKNLLMDLLGVTDVVFEWMIENIERAKENDSMSDDDEFWWKTIEINHNSSDIFTEITETKQQICDFILNPGSWWYGGNDNSDEPEGWQEETIIDNPPREPQAIASVDFGDQIIDFGISVFPCDSLSNEIEEGDTINILNDSYYDIGTGKVVLEDYGDSLTGSKMDDFIKGKKLNYDSIIFNPSTTEVFVLYTSHKFSTEVLRAKLKEAPESESRDTTIFSVLMGARDGNDYKLFPVSITSKEFGKL